MVYARINLSSTNYPLYKEFQILEHSNIDIMQLQDLYRKYCKYKKFKSVMPIFDEEFFDLKNDVIAYYENQKMVAFSLIRKFNDKNAEAIQFAWDYSNPKLELGFASLRSECALYKSLGFEYLYLGGADEYKRKIDGFEVLGPI